jgi:hypothetical protein
VLVDDDDDDDDVAAVRASASGDGPGGTSVGRVTLKGGNRQTGEAGRCAVDASAGDKEGDGAGKSADLENKKTRLAAVALVVLVAAVADDDEVVAVAVVVVNKRRRGSLRKLEG